MMSLARRFDTASAKFSVASGSGCLVGMKERDERDEFRRQLRQEWESLWRERFNDRVRAEGVSVRDYPLLLVDRGVVVFATRGAKVPSYSDIVDFWGSQGLVYSSDAFHGGWGKFIRTELKTHAHSRARTVEKDMSQARRGMQQSKKGGRGWLHK